ncbi:MAG: hypothetical protein U0271_21015 [Polyangiaceae bacterium]
MRTNRSGRGRLYWAGASALLLAISAGCAKPATNPLPLPPIKPAAAEHFSEGLSTIARLDATNGWTAETCESTARTFLEAEEVQGNAGFPLAVYNAGVAYQRCGDVAHAEPLFKRVVADDPKFHRARVQLAEIALNREGGDLNAAITEFERAVADSEFQNNEALVDLARAQMKRRNAAADKDGPDDLSRARKNLQRALAIDDNYMPAFEQLATNYLLAARAGAKSSLSLDAMTRQPAATTGSDRQMLELALLVASQGLRKNGEYAPLHNVAGIIYVELGDPTTAARRFAAARKLDQRLVAAHVNFAAVNLSFRGFAEAEEGYRAALALQPDDYDARVGLALALRGRIDEAQDAAAVYDDATQQLAAARKLDESRPEADFNEAILIAEYGPRVKGLSQKDATDKAVALYQRFVERARGRADLEAAVDDVTAVPTLPDDQCMGAAGKKHECKRGRIFDLKDALAFAEESAAEQRRLDEEAKMRAASADAATP